MASKARLSLVIALLGVFAFAITEINSDEPEGKAENRCVLMPDKGACKAAIVRYNYDCTTKTCVEFQYGGCGGNENNYESKDDCETTCFEAYCPPNARQNSTMGRGLGRRRRKERKRFEESSSTSESESSESESEERKRKKHKKKKHSKKHKSSHHKSRQ